MGLRYVLQTGLVINSRLDSMRFSQNVLGIRFLRNGVDTGLYMVIVR